MSVRERDPLTGHETTGHEWAGITELNTRVPRAVWFFIVVTHVWALVVWILMPAWPLVTTHTEGLLGTDQREQVEARVAAMQAARAPWKERIAEASVAEIRADPALAAHVARTAPALWGDNCAGCHGAAAEGAPGFPSLVDDDWLWGGDEETVLETLRVGINSDHPETRLAQMPAFGRDAILSRDEIRAVAAHVQALSGAAPPPADAAPAAQLFADTCAGCHGERGEGMAELGAPNLGDAVWLYGGDAETLFETVHDGRQGWMPAWEDRLSLAERKILAAHIQELAEGGPR